MDAFSSGLMLWLGLTSLLPKPPTYEIEHFYTYNREHKQVALPLQKRVFLPESEVNAAYVAKLTQKVDRLQAPNTPGWVVTLENNREAIDLMKQLAKDKIDYKPVVFWEGMAALPTNSVMLQTKPFVTEELLRKRLEESAKIKIKALAKDKTEWVLDVGETILPPNMLVLANMLAEDGAWFNNARVIFTPLFAPMSGSMAVTTPAVLNLGYDKQLEITITIYKPTVKIRQDLIPRLGQNRFVPQPQKDDVWYDFGPTTIAEEKTPEKTVIKAVTPFRFLMYNGISIPNIEIAYDDGPVKDTFQVQGINYFTQSVIKGTEIDDIQEFPQMPSIAVPPTPEKFARVILPWQRLGWAVGFLGCGMVVLVFALAVGRRYLALQAGRIATAANRKLWQDLYEAPRSADTIVGNWCDVYRDTSRKLAKVLKVFYNIHVPVSSDMYYDSNKPLWSILKELEKVHQPNSVPNPKELANQVAAFVKHWRTYEADRPCLNILTSSC